MQYDSRIIFPAWCIITISYFLLFHSRRTAPRLSEWCRQGWAERAAALTRLHGGHRWYEEHASGVGKKRLGIMSISYQYYFANLNMENPNLEWKESAQICQPSFWWFRPSVLREKPISSLSHRRMGGGGGGGGEGTLCNPSSFATFYHSCKIRAKVGQNSGKVRLGFGRDLRELRAKKKSARDPPPPPPRKKKKERKEIKRE